MLYLYLCCVWTIVSQISEQQHNEHDMSAWWRRGPLIDLIFRLASDIKESWGESWAASGMSAKAARINLTGTWQSHFVWNTSSPSNMHLFSSATFITSQPLRVGGGGGSGWRWGWCLLDYGNDRGWWDGLKHPLKLKTPLDSFTIKCISFGFH